MLFLQVYVYIYSMVCFIHNLLLNAIQLTIATRELLLCVVLYKYKNVWNCIIYNCISYIVYYNCIYFIFKLFYAINWELYIYMLMYMHRAVYSLRTGRKYKYLHNLYIKYKQITCWHMSVYIYILVLERMTFAYSVYH